MAEFAAAGGHWVLASMDRVEDGQVSAHVSITVSVEDEVSAESVDLAVEAGGEWLAQTARPGTLAHAATRAITAVGFFTFANPTNAIPTRAVVTLNGESTTFTYGDPGPLPVA